MTAIDIYIYIQIFIYFYIYIVIYIYIYTCLNMDICISSSVYFLNYLFIGLVIHFLFLDSSNVF